MTLVANILLLWLLSSSGEKCVHSEILLSVPKISFIPSWSVLPRGNVTICCEASITEGLSFSLKKDNWTIASSIQGDKGLAHFPITNVSSKDGGMYTCCYFNSSTSSLKCSEPLELLITDLKLPKPNITLSPKKLIYLGSNVSIQCSCKEMTQMATRRFYLHNDADKMKPESMKSDGDTATFSITVQEHNGGKYRCSYRAPSGDFISSKSSDDLELFLIDPYFPRPIISLGPTELVAFGGNVTFQCQSKNFSMRFYIQKSGEETLQSCLGIDQTTATCFISNVDHARTGEYSCRYSESKPFIISKSSELVRLLITDQNIPRPNISLIPNYIAQLGSKVTIQCSAQGPSKRFYLHKTGDKKNLQIAVTNEERKNFSINSMDWEDGGSFYCSYTEPSQFFISSETSDHVELFVVDPKLSKPSITLVPTQWVAQGGNATIICQSQQWAAKFLFEKSGKQMPLQPTEINGTMDTFFIKDAKPEDGGNYSCRYSAKAKPFIISEPSDLVTIKITDPRLPRPNISFQPSTIPLLGNNITIQCSVNNSCKAFYLYKGNGTKELQSVETNGSSAVFLINNVSEVHGGSYYCSYRPQSGNFISEPSDTMDLYLVDPALPIPAISMSPSNLVAFGEQVTIMCEAVKEAIKFYLCKDRDPSLNWTMESDLYRGTLSIHNISWDNKGNYSCSYVSEKRPKVLSLQSVPVELLVSERDHTQMNIIRFVIGSLVTVLLGFILTLNRRFQREQVH